MNLEDMPRETMFMFTDERRWILTYGLDALIADCHKQLGVLEANAVGEKSAMARFLENQLIEAKALKKELE